MGPMIIEECNLSAAWGKVFLKAYEAKIISPLVVAIDNLDGRDGPELRPIRSALDQVLEVKGKGSCHTVASTIFPKSLWNPTAGREALFECYLNMLPRLRKHKGNRNGLYFGRLISFNGFNQLNHVIETWHGGNTRRSALQASVFDPNRDHTSQRQRGFPCLMQLAFDPQGKVGLVVTGVYVTQYVVERCYGNILGLIWLGQFMAHEMGLTLTRVNCVATRAIRGDVPKRDLKQLAATVENSLALLPTEIHRG